LIPRLPGEQIGGRVFAAERGVLTDYEDLASVGIADDRSLRGLWQPAALDNFAQHR
jgi:hypothetical protein